MWRYFLSGVLLCLALAACKTTTEKTEVADASTVFFPEKLAEMDAAVMQNISSSRLPGGVLWLERKGIAYYKAYGNRAVLPKQELMTEDTIFDAASLTKVIATTPAIMLLKERGMLELEAPVARYIPEFGVNGKEKITIRQLLTHVSGLRPGIPSTPKWEGYAKAIELVCAEKPVAPAGTAFRYSDINFIILGEVVRRVSGKPLNEFAEAELYRPLRMEDTSFLPPKQKLPRIAPTEKVDGLFLRGVVHDPTARRMGGIAGHAGVFTSAKDLARFARMLLNGGELDGSRIFKPETVQLMTSVQTPAELKTRRGLGWDIDSTYAGPRGKFFPVGSFGHTGWTGTSLWIDPFSKTFLIFLSNRNHPDENGTVGPLRAQLGTLAAEAVRDFNFLHVPGTLERRAESEERPLKMARVLNGIDVLKREKFARFKGLRIGLITNHTGIDRERTPTIDLLHQAEGLKLVSLFSPEHGIRGALDENVSDGLDEKTGLPIYSLYGERRSPAPEQLNDIDALVFDIQDVGCRFYTYISTMGNCMEAAAKAGKKFVVLDRVNPINGVDLDGPVLKGESSFTGWHTLPVRHGMTVGELARMFNEEKNIQVQLEVVKIEGWDRAMYFHQTGLPWINPSPNMRSLTEAVLYPGVGLLETTPVSVGRGTDTPFEVVGAPYINEAELAWALNHMGIHGACFVPIQFTAQSSVFRKELCRGVNIILENREKCRVVDIGIAIALKLQQQYPEKFGLEKFNRLLVHPPTIEAIKNGRSLEEIRAIWQPELNEFHGRREKFLLYR